MWFAWSKTKQNSSQCRQKGSQFAILPHAFFYIYCLDFTGCKLHDKPPFRQRFGIIKWWPTDFARGENYALVLLSLSFPRVYTQWLLYANLYTRGIFRLLILNPSSNGQVIEAFTYHREATSSRWRGHYCPRLFTIQKARPFSLIFFTTWKSSPSFTSRWQSW